MITKICLNCSKEFCVAPYRKNTAKYCSHKCRSLIRKGEKAANWKNGRTKNLGYWFIYMPEHPFAISSAHRYIAEHRYMAECQLGRFLNPEEVIHHIDNNSENNLPENLYLFSSSAKHTKFHNLWDRPKLISNLP